jgi:hypothetical protein
MNEVTLHPDVYSTGASEGLVDLLKRIWVTDHDLGDGTLHLISGFGNYNGGVRFFGAFQQHVAAGGNVSAFLAGSANARLTSLQLVEELLKCGVHVTLVNRKRLLHAKAYGTSTESGSRLIVTSGNFTGPGMTQNAEIAVSLDEKTTHAMNFSWNDLEDALSSQPWDYYEPSLDDMSAPAWKMLYDELGREVKIEDSEEISLVITLGEADTARINAKDGSRAGTGSQYFWLSKDCYGFFPALTIRNTRGRNATYSTLIQMSYLDLGTVHETRVTFEAENNLDFRLGTGPLRFSKLAASGDLAIVSRRSERDYDLRIVRKNTAAYKQLYPHATNFVGTRGKKYGYVANSMVDTVLS